MKALTLTQPLASLVVLGAKRFDASCWRSFYRGPIAIHAASQLRDGGHDLALSREIRRFLLPAGWGDPEALPLGAIVGVVDLVEVYAMTDEDRPRLSGWEQSLGSYNTWRFLWRSRGAVGARRPVPATGMPGGRLWEWTQPGELRLMPEPAAVGVDVGVEGR